MKSGSRVGEAARVGAGEGVGVAGDAATAVATGAVAATTGAVTVARGRWADGAARDAVAVEESAPCWPRHAAGKAIIVTISISARGRAQPEIRGVFIAVHSLHHKIICGRAS